MVSYSVGASILLALHSTIVNAEATAATTTKRLRPSTTDKKKNVASNGRTGPSKNARTLYSEEYGMNMKVDTDKKCWDKVLGTPKVCVHVCITTVSNWIGDKLMNEYTEKPTESKCKDGWDYDHSYDDHSSGDGWHGYTEWPTYSPVSHKRDSWSGDGHDGWKCEEKPHKPSWSSPVHKSLHSIDEWSSHSTDHDRSWYSSSSGKSGKSGSSDWGSGKSGKSGSHSGDWGSGKSGKSGGYTSYEHSGKSSSYVTFLHIYKSYDARLPGYDDWVSSGDKLEWYSASDGKSGKSNSHRQLRLGTLKKVHGEWGSYDEWHSSSSDDDWHSGSGKSGKSGSSDWGSGKSGKSGGYDDDWAGGKSGKSGSGGGGSWGKSGKSGSGGWKSSGKKPSSSWKAITSIDKWTASPTICDTPTPTIITPEPSSAPTTCEERDDYDVWYWHPFGNTCNNGPDQGGSVGPSFTSSQACCTCVTAILNGQDSAADLCPDGFDTPNTPSSLGPGEIKECRRDDFCNPTPRPTHSPTSSPTGSPTGSPMLPAIVETPQPTTCLEREWFFDGQICTNGFLDSSNDGGILYTTLKDCCEDVFPQGTCDFNDICFTDSPTPSPTYSSTNGSTPTVSKETTGPPTTAIVPRRGTGAHKVSH